MKADQTAFAAERAAHEASKKALADTKKGLAAERAQHEATKKALAYLWLRIESLLSSSSWRITRPMRNAANYLRSFRKSPLMSSRPLEATPVAQFPTRIPQFHIDPADKRGHALLRHGGNLNPSTLKIWRRLVAECAWTHILDVGANYGEMLLGARMPKDAKIFAFEPNPLIAPYLEWNLSDGEISAEIVRSAVTDQVGTARLLIDRNWSGQTCLSVVQIGARELITVPTTTISAVLGDAANASKMRVLIKIDVEGSEARALASLMELLDSFEDFAALVEVLHVPPTDRNWILDEFEVELLDRSSGGLVRLAPATPGAFLAALKSGRFYRQDVVLRRKR